VLPATVAFASTMPPLFARIPAPEPAFVAWLPLMVVFVIVSV
jgi:hypothetical protein